MNNNKHIHHHLTKTLPLRQGPEGIWMERRQSATPHPSHTIRMGHTVCDAHSCCFAMSLHNPHSVIVAALCDTCCKCLLFSHIMMVVWLFPITVCAVVCFCMAGKRWVPHPLANMQRPISCPPVLKLSRNAPERHTSTFCKGGTPYRNFWRRWWRNARLAFRRGVPPWAWHRTLDHILQIAGLSFERCIWCVYVNMVTFLLFMFCSVSLYIHNCWKK